MFSREISEITMAFASSSSCTLEAPALWAGYSDSLDKQTLDKYIWEQADKLFGHTFFWWKLYQKWNDNRSKEKKMSFALWLKRGDRFRLTMNYPQEMDNG